MKVLELGCNIGRRSKELLRKYKNVEFTDKENSMIYGQIKKKVKICNLNQGRLPYRDESFDIVYAEYVLEHIYNINNTIRECYRVLKKKGKLIIELPNINSIFEKIYFLIKSDFIRWNLKNDHYTIITKSILEKYAQEMFRIEKEEYSKGIMPLTKIKLPAIKIFGNSVKYTLIKK